MAERKSQLDALALAIQLFISEHPQDLSLQQNQKMLQFLSELQRSFQGLVDHLAAQRDVVQSRLQQVQQEVQVEVRLTQKLNSLCLLGCLLGVSWPAYYDSRNLALPTSEFHVTQANVVWSERNALAFSCFMCMREYMFVCDCMYKCFILVRLSSYYVPLSQLFM